MATPKKTATLRVDLATHREIKTRSTALGLLPGRFLALIMRAGQTVEDIAVDQLARAAAAEHRRRQQTADRPPAPPPQNAPADPAPEPPADPAPAGTAGPNGTTPNR